MSSASPIFIEQFEEVRVRLSALASQHAVPWSKELAPEAARLLGPEQFSMLARTIAEIKDLSVIMGRSLETIKDLQLAKEPDVERLAEKIFVADPRSATPKDAFSKASQFILERNRLRSSDRNGSTPSAVQPRR
jgi:hypothetical protein